MQTGLRASVIIQLNVRLGKMQLWMHHEGLTNLTVVFGDNGDVSLRIKKREKEMKSVACWLGQSEELLQSAKYKPK